MLRTSIRFAPARYVFGVVIFAAACGSDSAGPSEPTPIAVAVNPASADLLVAGEATFSATVSGTPETAVTWSVVEQGGGAVSATGDYTAPPASGTFHVRAASVADPARHADAVVSVHGYQASFERVGDPATPYDNHTATLLADGSVLVVGGRGFAGTHAQTERYVPELRAFEPGPSLATARMDHAAALLSEGRLLVSGGWDFTDGSSPFDPALQSTEIYEPTSNRFVAGPTMNHPRRNHVMTPLAGGRVLVTGGIQLRGNGFAATANAEVFDPGTGAFAVVAPMGTGRWLHTATLLADGRVLVVGGRDNNCTLDCEWHSLGSAEIFDPATGDFAPTGSLGVSRFGHAAARLADGRVVVFGGSTTEDLGNTDQVTAIEVYDPATGALTPFGTTQMGRTS